MQIPANKAPVARRVYLVDDSHLVRRGLEVLIGQEPDLEVCGGADNAADAFAGICMQRPDLAIVDLRLRSSDGASLIKKLRQQGPEVKILVFSMYRDPFRAREVLGLGADGYMTKSEQAEKVVPALRQLLAGKTYVSQELSG